MFNETQPVNQERVDSKELYFKFMDLFDAIVKFELTKEEWLALSEALTTTIENIEMFKPVDFKTMYVVDLADYARELVYIRRMRKAKDMFDQDRKMLAYDYYKHPIAKSKETPQTD